MRRNVTVVGAIAALLLATAACLVGQGGATGGQGRGGGRGMMGSMLYLERTWTAISFQLGCTGQQIEALRPTYRNALAARDAALKTAMAARDWQAAGKAMQDSKTRLDTKLKVVLSTQQWAKLQQLLQPPAGAMRPGGGGTGPPGGTGR